MSETLLSVEEARARILAGLARLPAEEVALMAALGRVLGEAIVAPRASPPAAVSAMDGYALRAGSVAGIPVELPISQTIAAGMEAVPLERGTAARIFTGAVVPEGADAIVIQEDTERRGDRVVIKDRPLRGRHIRAAGSDFAAGSLGLAAGRTLSARDVGLAAAMNAAHVRVARRPRVAILSTGDELIAPGGSPKPHQIIASNGPALAAALTLWGAAAIDLGVARDDEMAIARAIEGAGACDLLLTLGGVSVGEHDLVQAALKRVGFMLDFWRVAMRPGKPLIFGHMGAMPVLGLPGNPVSALVCALLFVRPMIRTWLGCAHQDGTPDVDLPHEQAVLARALPANGPRADYLRGRLSHDTSGLALAESFPAQDSSHLKALAEADCLIPRTPFAPESKSGEAHTIVPLAGLF